MQVGGLCTGTYLLLFLQLLARRMALWMSCGDEGLFPHCYADHFTRIISLIHTTLYERTGIRVNRDRACGIVFALSFVSSLCESECEEILHS